MSFQELTMIDVREMQRRLQAGQSARKVARDGVVDRKTATRYFEAARACEIGPETELSDALVAEVAQRVQARPETPPSDAWKVLEANRSRIEAWLRGEQRLRLVRQSRMDNSREVLMTELCTIDLLIVDDFALEPMTREESRDVYQLFVERNARSSTIVTNNRDTAEWLAVFDDTLLAQSAVDRFKNNAYDLVIDGESYRARLKPRVEAEEAPPAAPVKKQPTGRRRNLMT